MKIDIHYNPEDIQSFDIEDFWPNEKLYLVILQDIGGQKVLTYIPHASIDGFVVTKDKIK